MGTSPREFVTKYYFRPNDSRSWKDRRKYLKISCNYFGRNQIPQKIKWGADSFNSQMESPLLGNSTFSKENKCSNGIMRIWSIVLFTTSTPSGHCFLATSLSSPYFKCVQTKWERKKVAVIFSKHQSELRTRYPECKWLFMQDVLWTLSRVQCRKWVHDQISLSWEMTQCLPNFWK